MRGIELLTPGIILLAALAICLSCGEKLTHAYVQQDDIEWQGQSTSSISERGRCSAIEHYIPDTTLHQCNFTRPIRVNVHFMNASDSTQNMPEERARRYAHEVLYYANQGLSKNLKMHLPLRNQTPVLSIPWRYEITPSTDDITDDGIYFHYDDDLYFYVKKGKDRNNSSREVIKRYALRADSVLNFFFMPHHPDSVASPTYRADGGGIALGTSMKLAGKWNTVPDPASIKGLINHEAGHILGLSHTWSGNDGCDDTPPHPNCWHPNIGGACDSLWSNNMMDYNAWQAALTPCQIGKVMRNIARENSRQRRLIKPVWCALDTAYNVTIADSTRWSGAMDLKGHLIIAPGGVLEILCRVAMPENGKIIVRPGGTIIFNGSRVHHDCDAFWEGIEVYKSGDKKGRILMIGDPRFENVRNPVPAYSDMHQKTT